MVPGHDSVQLILGGFVFFEATRLVVDEGDCIPFFRVVTLQREELTHGVKRHENSDVRGVLFFVPILDSTPITSKRAAFSRMPLPSGGRPGDMFRVISRPS